jgi:hypothetical protein
MDVLEKHLRKWKKNKKNSNILILTRGHRLEQFTQEKENPWLNRAVANQDPGAPMLRREKADEKPRLTRSLGLASRESQAGPTKIGTQRKENSTGVRKIGT